MTPEQRQELIRLLAAGEDISPGVGAGYLPAGKAGI